MKQPNKFNSQLQQEILGSFQQLVKIPNHPGADQKKCPSTLSCRATPLFVLPSVSEHPSLRSGQRPGMSFRGAQAPRDPSLRSG